MDSNRVLQSITVLGVSFKTLTTEGRESFAKAVSDREGFLKDFKEDTGVSEVVLISTCNRSEIVFVANSEEAVSTVGNFIERRTGIPVNSKFAYCYSGRDAISHFFRVVSSLDSMVIGEPQILGQVKDAYQLSVGLGMVGKILHRLFQYGFRIAKRIRDRSGIADKGVSVSYIAVKLAEQIFGSLSEQKVMIIGVGEMSELTAIHLKEYGCQDIVIANRTPQRAKELANLVGGTVANLEDVPNFLKQADIVISAVGASEPIIKTEAISTLRRLKPLFIIDLGMPRNVPEGVGEIEDVYLYNVDDLGRIVEENRASRDLSAKDAEVSVSYATYQFKRWLFSLKAQPFMDELWSRVMAVCSEEFGEDLEKAEKLGRKVIYEVNRSIKEIVQAEGEEHKDKSVRGGKVVKLPLLCSDPLKSLGQEK